MRPERCRETLKSVGLARARMFLKAHLDWLDGAPVAQSAGRIQWRKRPRIGSPEGTTIVVDHDLIRETQSVLSKLTRRFPQAIHRLVGDVSSWERNVNLVLDRLKQALDRGVELIRDASLPVEILSAPDRRIVEKLLRRLQSLSPILRFAVWPVAIRPELQNSLIPWLSDNADWITDHFHESENDCRLETILLVGDLIRVDGDDCVNFIRPGLSSEFFRTHTCGLRNEINTFLKDLRNWRHPKNVPSRPKAPSTRAYGPQIVEFVMWLTRKDRPVRNRAVRLARLVLLTPVVQSWRQGWSRLHNGAHHAIRSLCLIAKQSPGVHFHSEANRISYEFESKLKDDPLSYPVEAILANVCNIAESRSPEFTRSLVNLLSAVAVNSSNDSPDRDGWALRLALLHEASDIRSESRGIQYFDLSRQFLIRNRNRGCSLRPWAGLVAWWNGNNHLSSSPRVTLFDELPDTAKWTDFFGVLDRIAGERCYNFRKNNALAWLLTISSDAEQAGDRFRQLSACGLLDNCSVEQLRVAASLESDGYSLSEFVELLEQGSSIRNDQLPSLMNLHVLFRDAGWQEVIPHQLRQRQSSELTRVVTQFQILQTSGMRLIVAHRPVSANLPDWASRLPAVLQPPVAMFGTVFPQSRSQIQRILQKHFPDELKLCSEIETLQRLVCATLPPSDNVLQHTGNASPISDQNVNEHRRRRLLNLIQRLEHPRQVPESTVIALRKLLHEALLTELFRDCSQRIETRLKELVGNWSDRNTPDNLTLPHEHVELIQGILGLPQPYRDFGLRLLRKQWGGEPWDVAQEHANRQFLENMATRGIDIRAWLANRDCRIHVEGQPEPWTLAFETNEVEKLLMGHYFSTCLSPDGCNFYSAVVNSIDINKRILYARDCRGKVTGRALLALSDLGTIQVFKPYCHGESACFERAVASFATALALEMRTVVSHSDHVSPLLTPDWYDDGAYDLGNSMTGEQSSVRIALRNATVQTVVALLEQALHPVELTDAMIESIVELPEFQQRPQLVEPLIPMIVHREHKLAVRTLIVTGRLAYRAGLNDVAARLLVKHATDWTCRQWDRFGFFTEPMREVLQWLITYHPSLALRILRSTRPDFVHRDQDETDSDRRTLLAETMKALGRHRIAADLCRPA